LADPTPTPNDVDPGQTPDDTGQTPTPHDDDVDDPGQKPDDDSRQYPESYVRKLRRESNGYRTRLVEIEQKLQAIEDGEKSESQKLTEKVSALEKRANDAEGRLIRYEVAADRKLDMQAATFLTGTTREEIEASADELAKLLKDRKPPSSFDGGSRDPVPDDRPADQAHNDLLLRALGRSPQT
jgi:hypothetical protein